MEYIPPPDSAYQDNRAHTLIDRIQLTTEKKFNDRTAHKYAAEILAGLIYLHKKSIVHRDLHGEKD